MGQAAEVIVEELVLALVGLSAGAAVAGGLFSFIVELGVIADFADRTHTGDKFCLGFLPGFLSDAGRWRVRRY